MKTVLPLLLLAASPLVAQSPVQIRIMPPEDAQFLQFQRFDVRVEAAAPAGTTVGELRVALDGRDITSIGTVSSPSPNVTNWTFRQMYLGGAGVRTLTATSGDVAARSRITVRALRTTVAAQPRARNVILFIGDGMGIAARTAARVLAKGYTRGKANGTLAMDRLPFNGMLMTSSLDSLVTDSSAGAQSFVTGNKTNNGMEGVFPDNTDAEHDNPRVENLSEWAYRTLGMVTGIVTDAYVTDATPSAIVAHVPDRTNGPLIASQYFDTLGATGLTVLLGGGTRDFLPRSAPGSNRSDERNVLAEFRGAGFDFVDTRTALTRYAAGPGGKLLGLFARGSMNTAFDKLKAGNPGIVAAFPDQPFLGEMTRVAIDVLKQHPTGFFLMVEGALIDAQAHSMDAERTIYDVIQLDQAVQVALDFAQTTNRDADPNNDTLVIVTADHETAGVSLPGVANPALEGRGRDYVKSAHYAAPRNDTTQPNFTDYADANGDGYPDDPDPERKLIVSFGANSDRHEDWMSNANPKSSTANANGIAVANPNDPDRATGVVITGAVSNGEHGGEPQLAAVHTLADVPVSAYGPGAWQFARVADNTEVFFNVVSAILGQYAGIPQ